MGSVDMIAVFLLECIEMHIMYSLSTHMLIPGSVLYCVALLPKSAL
jgi:hypothetical protein